MAKRAARRRSSSSVTPVVFDNIDAGGANVTSFAGSLSTSWSHTAAGAAGYALIPVAHRCNGINPSGITRTCTYGGAAATLLATVIYSAAAGQFVDFWGFPTPPTTAQTIAVNNTGGGSAGRAISGICATYANVGAVDLADMILANASSTSAAVSIGGTQPNEIVVCLMGDYNGAFSTGSFSHTFRGNKSSSDGFARVLVGEAAGGSSDPINFSCPLASSSPWGAAAIRLQPAA